MKKPLIGIVLDNEEGGAYSEFPYYVLRKHYFDAVTRFGGIPVGIDHQSDNISSYVALLDGLLLPGGDYDIPPHVYGDTEVHHTVTTKENRLAYDMAITQAFLTADKPILGICVGEQLLAVLAGGSLVQDIGSEVVGAYQHYGKNREVIAHEVTVEPGTHFSRIVGVSRMGVNSHHHQAVRKVGPGTVVTAKSDDGVIEAIELVGKRFCLGVQWHPEFLHQETDQLLFKAFVAACS